MQRTLFDDNPNLYVLEKDSFQRFFSLLNNVTLEYALQQLIKLHDPAIMNGKINLTINCIVQYGDWEKKVRTDLKSLSDELELLAGCLRAARNKVLSHNDFLACMENVPIGCFEENKDRDYFDKLQEFVNIVHDKTIGGPYPFDSLVQSYTREFLSALK